MIIPVSYMILKSVNVHIAQFYFIYANQLIQEVNQAINHISFFNYLQILSKYFFPRMNIKLLS